MCNCCRPPHSDTIPIDAQDPAPNKSSAPLFIREAVNIAGGKSFVGSNHPVIEADGEGPERAVTLSPYAISATTVTNEEFAQFVAATGYVTDAERIGWSPVFSNNKDDLVQATSVGNRIPWWKMVEGANWHQPEGPGSDIADRADHPVVQVSWNDANAYSHWAGVRLPTEAEWEHAARSGTRRQRFPWGDTEPTDSEIFCNIWQGTFPHNNTLVDGYMRTAPARSFNPNEIGLYNMVGNVWEWTNDAFKIRSLSKAAKQRNSTAAQHSEKVLKGGSFLCHISYCYRYRIAARMGMSPDSAGSNVGFRVALSHRP